MSSLTSPDAPSSPGATGPRANDSPPWSLRWAYTTEDGTANAGDDYTAVSGHVVIPSGATTASVVVQTTADIEDDDEEAFKLKLFDFQTQGFVRGSNLWTSAFQVEGVPTAKTMVATIRE